MSAGPARRVLVPAAAGLLAAVALAGGLAGAGPASPWRHAYLVPVAMAALAGGARGGALAAVAAVLLQAPAVLAEVEQAGLTARAGEALASFAVLGVVGGLGGALGARARRDRLRYATLVAARQALADAERLDEAVARVRALLASRLAADALAVVVRDGERLVLAGAARLAPGSVAARVLAASAPAWIADAGGCARPRRAFVTPLLARGEVVGVLALERLADIGAEERAALRTLGADLGLALENARLAARQRRFADELAARVAEAARARSAFVATASHELRTPLTALGGFSEVLATRDLDPGEVRRLGGILVAETRRLGRIVGDLLDLARIERGEPPPLRRERLAVEAVLARAVALFQAGGAGGRVTLECQTPLPRLWADPDALERVLANLLSNALKYAPPGSPVRVRARSCGAPPRAVEVTVADTGPGIPPEALPRLFEPYYRGPGAAGLAGGSGLGLAVVQALVEAHGGTVRVASAPGAGTEVAVLLPVP